MIRRLISGWTPWLVALAGFGVVLWGMSYLEARENTAAPVPTTKLEYNRDIRPILTETCFACHGPDSAARKADLRLDRREDAIASGSIVPGKPEQSSLVERVFETQPSKIMPPPKAHKVLTPKQKEMLKTWVAQGAEYQLHWSFLPPKRPTLPGVANKTWVRNPIDQFILAGLEAKGLTPAPEADRRTLARRLSLDLTGLPPEPALVESFVNDRDPQAYEKLVDKLMARPEWGEHRARFWLDAARYADTHGIHFDNFREMWSYREWVIQAFNRNIPFSQFTLEQIAGDLLPDAGIDQKIATGFNRCNITTSEGGAIAEEYLVLYARDRTETMAQVFLGLTAGCAVCHNHKFDPITMKDFYALSAFFNNTPQAAMDGNVKDTPPIIPVPRSEDRTRWEQIGREMGELRQKVEKRKKEAKPEFEAWLAGAKAEEMKGRITTVGQAFHAPLRMGEGKPADNKSTEIVVGGATRQLEVKGATWATDKDKTTREFQIKTPGEITIPQVGDWERDKPFTISTWFRFPRGANFGSILARMDKPPVYRGWDLWLENGRIGTHIVSSWPTSAIKVLAKRTLNPDQWHHITVTYDGSSKASGVKIYIDGILNETDIANDNLSSTIKTSVSLRLARREASGEGLANIRLRDIRLYDRSLNQDEVMGIGRNARLAEILAKDKAKRTPAENDELFAFWIGNLDKPFTQMARQLEALEREEGEIRARGTIAHIMVEKGMEASAFILARGEYDKRKDQVKPATPEVLHPMPSEFPKNRLGLARWLLREDNPLTDRVTVNRFWQEVFGNGIVRTAGDFGITGELPSHPELLDWLALEFRERKYDIKSFFKLVVTSATYRQAAITTPEKREKDPSNKLLSRGPRFRMDAEMIRDYALSASGLLVPKIGGPSVKPYQPEGVWEAVAMIGSNTRDYRADRGENLYRRSLYTFWKRSAPPANMEIFNAPNRETCTVRRERTNTPLQALVTLNDVQFVEAAKVLAQKALFAGKESNERAIDEISLRLLGRPLKAEEKKVVLGECEELISHYRAHPEEAKKLLGVGEFKVDPAADPIRLASLTMVANSLFNLDEVLCK